MKVKLIKRSADNRLVVELEDDLRRYRDGSEEDGSTALRRLEMEANYFLSAREDRLKFGKRPAAASANTKTPQGNSTTASSSTQTTLPFRATTQVSPAGATTSRPVLPARVVQNNSSDDVTQAMRVGALL